MEKKLAVIVDNNEIATEVADTEMCSSVCDVAMETCSSQSHDACGVRSSAVTTVRSESRLRSTYPGSLSDWRAQSAKTELSRVGGDGSIAVKNTELKLKKA